MAFSTLDFGGCACRYLQHRRSLTYAEMCQQDDLSVRELKRVAMTVRLPFDLAETGHLVAERAGNDEPGFAFYLAFKGKLVPGSKQTATFVSSTEAKPRVIVW